jgi:putative peptide zinc metalloprotease protein
MISSAPKLRSDLVVRRQETAEGTFFIVKNPDSGEFFRFREAEQFIAQQLDGETALDAVRRTTEETFGATLPAETLSAFVKNLEKTGLLEREETKKRKGKSKRGRIRGSLLYLRVKILDPARLLDRLLPRLRFFFTPHFMVFSTALILLAAGTIITNSDQLVQDLSRFRLSSIPLFMVVIFFVISLHEFAHGLTCRYFGGEVREMGFLLIYFQPALYCNVSDAWLFPEKSKRLWVGFAGPYFELFLWALSALAWRVTDTETWINYLALIVTTSSGVKTLLNLNPFLKYDGYYLLSDCVEIPNLRRKAYRYIGSLLERLVGRDSQISEVSRRERKILLSYGLVAAVGSFSFLAYILVSAGGYLIENRQPEIFLLSTGYMGIRVRRRFRKLFGNGADPDDPDGGEEFKTSDGAESPKPDKRDKSGTNKSGAWHRPAMWTALAVVTLAVLFLGRLQQRIAGPFNVLPIENADVRTQVDGIIEKIYVDEGDKVRTGDVIARLSDDALGAELEKVESDLAAKRARLQMLVAGPRAEEIALATKAAETGNSKLSQTRDLYTQAKRARDERLALTETSIKKAEERLQFGQKNLEMFQTLVEQQLGSRMQLDEAAEQVAVRKRELEEARSQKQVLLAEELAEERTNVAVAEKEVKEGEAKLQLLLAGTRTEEIQALKADIKRSEAEQAFFRIQLAGTQITSPATGIIATPSRQLKELRGQMVKQGDLIAKVYDFKTVTAQIVISEKEIAPVEVGQQVVLRTRAHPDQTFYGTVTSIATSAQGSSSSGSGSGSSSGGQTATTSSSGSANINKTILVNTQIENQSLLLKPEMTGQAKIFCGQRRIFDLITWRTARTLKVDVWSWW